MEEDKILSFRKLISELEDKKWEILLRKGDYAASEEWKVLNQRLDRLYRWWSKEFGAQLRPYIPKKFR